MRTINFHGKEFKLSPEYDEYEYFVADDDGGVYGNSMEPFVSGDEWSAHHYNFWEFIGKVNLASLGINWKDSLIHAPLN